MTQHEGDGKWSLESQSSYLLLLAQFQMPRQLRSRFDPADAVQQTQLQAHRKIDQCQAETEAEFRVWLREILKNILAEELRRFARQQGEGGPDVPIQELEESWLRFEKFLAADDSTPSQRLMREEQLVRLAEAIAALPADQQQAVRLHHLDGHSLIEVGQRMNRSKEAVAGLLFRGLKRLRDDLGEL
jgi:RNA polymerase sigma-70 factor, ECF subfamily